MTLEEMRQVVLDAMREIPFADTSREVRNRLTDQLRAAANQLEEMQKPLAGCPDTSWLPKSTYQQGGPDNKIADIKALRQMFGAGLKATKDAVELMYADIDQRRCEVAAREALIAFIKSERKRNSEANIVRQLQDLAGSAMAFVREHPDE